MVSNTHAKRTKQLKTLSYDIKINFSVKQCNYPIVYKL